MNINTRISELRKILKKASGMAATSIYVELSGLEKLKKEGHEEIIVVDLKH